MTVATDGWWAVVAAHRTAFGVIAGVILLYLVVIGWLVVRIRRTGRLVTAAEGWRRATGTVTATEIREHRIRLPKGGYAISYEPVVRYDYAVGGRSYRGDRRVLGDAPLAVSFERRAERHLARYPVGSSVEVWIDPADPSRAVLERRAPVIVRDRVLLVVLLAVLVGFIAVLASYLPGVRFEG